MHTLRKFVGTLFAVALATTLHARVWTTTVHARVWTTTDNRTFEADYVSATATHVMVKLKDGRTAPVEIVGR
jgi:hypothetical protein